MFSFLTPYLTIIKGAGLLIVVLAVWYFIHQYRTGQEAKAELATVKQSLTDERSCLVGTVCATKLAKSEQDAAQQVNAAQQKAERQNQEAKERSEAQANEYANQTAKALNQHQTDLAVIQAKHNPSCDEQRKLVIVCALQ